MNKGLTEKNKQIEVQLSFYTCKNVSGIIFNYYLNEEEEDYFYSMLRNKTVPKVGKKMPLSFLKERKNTKENKNENGVKFIFHKGLDFRFTKFDLSLNKWKDYIESFSLNLVGLLIDKFTHSSELKEFGLINLIEKTNLKFLYMNCPKYNINPIPGVMNFKKSMSSGSYFIFVYFVGRTGRGIRRRRMCNRGGEKRTLYVSKDLNGKFKYCILNESNNIVQNSFGKLCR